MANLFRRAHATPADMWFVLPVVFAMLMDACITLTMQPREYWSNHAMVAEGNATWRVVLELGPAYFVAGFIVYAVGISLVLAWLRGVPQKLLGAFVLLSHSYGSASWVHGLEDGYWWALMGVLLSQTLAFGVYWWRSPWNAPTTTAPRAS